VCNTYRFHGHHAGDPLNYREKEEVERWRLRDPIEQVKQALVDQGTMQAGEIDALEQRIEQQIEDAVAFARSSPDPTADQLMTDIYA
jgi:TPP-dependent pyruvate/acetoin dehydrogenase alpha subunit